MQSMLIDLALQLLLASIYGLCCTCALCNQRVSLILILHPSQIISYSGFLDIYFLSTYLDILYI
jgi:hypothetical protein